MNNGYEPQQSKVMTEIAIVVHEWPGLLLLTISTHFDNAQLITLAQTALFHKSLDFDDTTWIITILDDVRHLQGVRARSLPDYLISFM